MKIKSIDRKDRKGRLHFTLECEFCSYRSTAMSQGSDPQFHRQVPSMPCDRCEKTGNEYFQILLQQERMGQ
jgi:hypothetical protein